MLSVEVIICVLGIDDKSVVILGKEELLKLLLTYALERVLKDEEGIAVLNVELLEVGWLVELLDELEDELILLLVELLVELEGQSNFII